LEATPHSLDTLRINEGMLAILLAGGVSPQPAAWAIDAAFRYIGSDSVMSLRRQPEEDAGGAGLDRAEVIERLEAHRVSEYGHVRGRLVLVTDCQA
jgi:hypothetical protein